MLTTCDAEGGPEYLAGTFDVALAGLMSPTIYYLAFGYGGVVSSNFTVVLEGVVQGLKNIQTFVNPNAADITAATLLIAGVDDDLEPADVVPFFNALSADTKKISTILNFTAETGAALHCQVGGEMILDKEQWDWLLSVVPITSVSIGAMDTPLQWLLLACFFTLFL